VADLDCDIYYSFTKDKLTVGGYNFKQDYTNKILYIDDYKSLQELLTKKYGKPIEDQVVWNDNTYKNNKDKWDKALEAGHMKMLSSWETSKTKIDLNLSGVTSSVHITLSYKSKKNNDLNKSSKESKSLEGL
ncbi:MAG TPA: hypothetical protein VHO28_11340, partial [Ignavibacteriales bacterium]|nr:hypothetical protein [Ignavibacteriales bacterium]